jgi:hypothetical protein
MGASRARGRVECAVVAALDGARLRSGSVAVVLPADGPPTKSYRDGLPCDFRAERSRPAATQSDLDRIVETFFRRRAKQDPCCPTIPIEGDIDARRSGPTCAESKKSQIVFCELQIWTPFGTLTL